MINIPVKANERIISNVKRFQKIITTAKSNDINEADTVSIVKDILCEILGFDKYSEITSEYAIKKTFCDLAIKKDGTPYILVEVKAVGINLKDDHTKQALDYGANCGVDWIILTNAVHWKIYKIVFSKPIQSDLVYEFSFEDLNIKKQADIEMLYYISKEAANKSSSALNDLREQRLLLSRFLIGQILMTDDTINTIKKTLKKICSNSKVTSEEIKQVLEYEVIKREIFDDEKSIEAKKKVDKTILPAETKSKPIIKESIVNNQN
ncbi:MAG: type I restriction enzyme HsdR N-terminal domain-containing protein [Christensenellales bacterium]